MECRQARGSAARHGSVIGPRPCNSHCHGPGWLHPGEGVGTPVLPQAGLGLPLLHCGWSRPGSRVGYVCMAWASQRHPATLACRRLGRVGPRLALVCSLLVWQPGAPKGSQQQRQERSPVCPGRTPPACPRVQHLAPASTARPQISACWLPAGCPVRRRHSARRPAGSARSTGTAAR